MKPGWKIILLGLLLWGCSNAAIAAGSLPDKVRIVEENWEEIFRDQGVVVYSQRVSESFVLAFKAVGLLHAPVEQVMEVLRRVEITGEWMPDIVTKHTVKEFSDFEAITYSVNDMPWPFDDREMVLVNKLRLDKVRRFLVVDVYSVDYGSIPVGKGNVRAHMYCGETLLRPVGKDQTEIQMILFIDPKGYIPSWLVNMSQRRLPYNFLKALEKKASESNYPLRPSFQKILNDLISLMNR